MKKDLTWKDYLADNARYADFINAFAYEGKEIVHADDIMECDTANADGTNRDLLRKIALGFQCAIFGIEHQENLDYAYPVREMGYTYNTYNKQVKNIKAHNKKYPKILSSRERLYKFRKDDRLFPTITYLLYAGEEEWDGPTSLKDMLILDHLPKALQEAVQNYKIQLIDIHKLTEEEVNRLRTDLRHIFNLIRLSKDDIGFEKEIINNQDYYTKMPEDAYNLASHYTKLNASIKIKTDEGGIDVCQAIEKMKIKEQEKTTLELIRNAMESLKMSFDEVCDALKVKDREQYRNVI
ncbi:MAG: Rpn family recombination-promoting nuclease/putative transposase [Lachnospiraceae bacterium]|nr:Rpn family recombination-promoting nuclease/putative transposase [Lachnospiraceae bacterium]